MHEVFHTLQEGHTLLGVAEAVIEATAQPAAIADQDLLSEEIEAQFLKIDLKALDLGALLLPSQGSIVGLLKVVLKEVHLLLMRRWSQPKMGLITAMVLE